MPFKLILFDLDGTLYTRDTGLLKEVGRRIQIWLCDHLELTWADASVVRQDYFQRYGTTMGGLVAEHEVDVYDYLTFVHNIPVEAYLQPNPALASMLSALPLRRAIYTNATAEYSWRVLDVLGVADCFERVVGIEEVALRNKPYRDAYERTLALLDAQGSECIMVEDAARNLVPAKALGMATLLVGTDDATSDETLGKSVDFVLESVLKVGQVVTDLLEDKKRSVTQSTQREHRDPLR